MTTKKELTRIYEQDRKLAELGFTYDEAETLRRISRTLSRWAERECNGEVEVDDDGKAYSVSQGGPWNGWKVSRWSTANREAGALKRLSRLMAGHPGWKFYHQGDPRGVALYIYRLDDHKPGQHIDSIYNSIGIPVW